MTSLDLHVKTSCRKVRSRQALRQLCLAAVLPPRYEHPVIQCRASREVADRPCLPPLITHESLEQSTLSLAPALPPSFPSVTTTTALASSARARKQTSSAALHCGPPNEQAPAPRTSSSDISSAISTAAPPLFLYFSSIAHPCTCELTCPICRKTTHASLSHKRRHPPLAGHLPQALHQPTFSHVAQTCCSATPKARHPRTSNGRNSCERSH